MDAAFYFQLSWALALVGWLVAVVAVRKGYKLWRTNGELAQRYWTLKKAYDKLIEQHEDWCLDENTDPNGISFDDLKIKKKKG